MRIELQTQRGHVLVTALILAALIGVTMASYMTLVGRQNYLTMRSKAWASEIPFAEAGIEEAMVHLNTRPPDLAVNGWTKSNDKYLKLRTFNDGYFYTTISTDAAPTIVSIGFARVPTQTNFTYRTVMITTRKRLYGYGVLARGQIELNSNVKVDSFDSSDPLYSTNGRYDPTKRTDHARVGSLGTSTLPLLGGLLPPVTTIDLGGADVYGIVATTPSGKVNVGSGGAVGDGTWVESQSGIQSGHGLNDIAETAENVSVPFTSGYLTPGSGTVNGTNYQYVLGKGDYKISSLDIKSAEAMIITGKARLHVDGSVACGGAIYIAPGGSIELYIKGSTLDLGGRGVVNYTGSAENCLLYGLPTLTTVTFRGTSDLVGVMHMPQANVKMSGTPSLTGSIVCNSLTMSGTAEIHYDEALGLTTRGAYQITSWEEL